MTEEAVAIEEEEEDGGGMSTDEGGGIMSPAGVVMMAIAVFFSLIGLIPVVGDFSDIAAVIVIGGLLLIMGKMRPGLIIGFILSAILEAIPIVADLVPFVSLLAMLFGAKLPISWIGFVYSVFSGNPIASVASGGGKASGATAGAAKGAGEAGAIMAKNGGGTSGDAVPSSGSNKPSTAPNGGTIPSSNNSYPGMPSNTGDLPDVNDMQKEAKNNPAVRLQQTRLEDNKSWQENYKKNTEKELQKIHGDNE